MKLAACCAVSMIGACVAAGVNGCARDDAGATREEGAAIDGAAMTGGAGASGSLPIAGAAGSVAGAAGVAGTGTSGAGAAGSGAAGEDLPDAGAIAGAGSAGTDAAEPDAGPGAGGTDGVFDEVCSPEISFENSDPGGAGASFDAAVPDPESFLLEIAQTVCEILYHSPDEPRTPASITLHVYSFDGVANAGGGNINLSTRHLANYSGAALLEEITGVLVHETTHLYQYNDGPGGLIEGMADFVRIEAGHHSLNRRNPGGSWDDGYTTTGFFIAWLDDRYPDFGYLLNQSMARDDNQGWSEQVFDELTGMDVDSLWQEYQDAL